MIRATLRRAGATAALLVVAVAGRADAQNVLWWVDGSLGGNTIPGALTLLQSTRSGLTVQQAADQSDFNTLLASGSYQLAIFGQQYWNWSFDNSSSVFTSFLAGGGKILGASWVAGSSSMATFFGASAGTTQNESSIGGSGPLFNGITGSVDLANPGWGVYAVGYSTSNPCLASFGSSACAAVEGNGGNTLLLGPLFDSYQDQAVGEQFVANAADHLLGAPATVTPEPATLTLLGTGLAGVAGALRRRRKSA